MARVVVSNEEIKIMKVLARGPLHGSAIYPLVHMSAHTVYKLLERLVEKRMTRRKEVFFRRRKMRYVRHRLTAAGEAYVQFIKKWERTS